MSSKSTGAMKLAVIGGGISGLAAALKLSERFPNADLKLYEAGPRLGGQLQTTTRDGFLIERAADMFITSEPWALDLAQRIGFDKQLIGTADPPLGAWVRFRGRMRRVPAGFQLMAPARLWPMVTTGLLSPIAKLRLALEPWMAARLGDEDESLQSFITRRFGHEVYDHIVEPLAGGIYTADGSQLSVNAAFARFREMERRDGSLTRGMRRERRQGGDLSSAHERGARYRLFVAPRDGMGSWVEAIAKKLPPDCVQLQAAVSRVLAGSRRRWRLEFGSDQANEVDGVVLAVPAYAAANLVHDLDQGLATQLSSISYAPSAIVTLAVRRTQVTRSLTAFGYVVPCIERKLILACSFSSLKFPGRAPEDSLLMRVFVGGALNPDHVDREDDELGRGVCEELAADIGLVGSPQWSRVERFSHAIPQYCVGHPQRVAAIESQINQHAELALAGNALHGIGIPHCVKSGEQAAQKLMWINK